METRATQLTHQTLHTQPCPPPSLAQAPLFCVAATPDLAWFLQCTGFLSPGPLHMLFSLQLPSTIELHGHIHPSIYI